MKKVLLPLQLFVTVVVAVVIVVVVVFELKFVGRLFSLHRFDHLYVYQGYFVTSSNLPAKKNAKVLSKVKPLTSRKSLRQQDLRPEIPILAHHSMRSNRNNRHRLRPYSSKLSQIILLRNHNPEFLRIPVSVHSSSIC